MLLDAQLQFSAAQALTATAVSTNVIDLGAVRQIGVGEPLSILVCVIVAADFTTANETYQIDIQTDDNSAFSSATTLSSTILTAAQLTLGAVRAIAVPRYNMERYLRLNYTLGGTTPTVTLSTWLQPTGMISELPTQYADAITITG
jgi:hypothetical protein